MTPKPSKTPKVLKTRKKTGPKPRPGNLDKVNAGRIRAAEARQDAVIAEALQGRPAAQIAEKLGIKISTVYQIQHRDSFKVRFDQMRKERMDAVKRQLETLATLATAAHLRVLRQNLDADHPNFLKVADRQLASADSVFDRVGLTRAQRIEQTTEFSGVVATFSQEFESRTAEELEHYALNGYWPDQKKTKKKP